MCQPKPGPRCSSHAREQVTRLQEVLDNYAPASRTLENPSYYEAWNDLQAAKEIYDSTSAGREALINQLKQTTDTLERANLEARIERGINLREHQKEALRLTYIKHEERAREAIEMAVRGLSIHSSTDLELAEKELEIAQNGGRATFQALFDTDGNRIEGARLVDTRYGKSWVIDNGAGAEPIWFSPSKAQDPDRKKATDAKKGFYVGRVESYATVRREYTAQSRYNGTSTLAVRPSSRHGDTTGDVVLDNGTNIQPVKEPVTTDA